MFALILVLLLLWVVLMGLLVAWTLWLQGYLYTEPTPGVLWRGPAAGSAIMLFVLLWVVLGYRSPGRYQAFWQSASGQDSKLYPELRIPTLKGEEVYKLRTGTREYKLNGLTSGKPLPSRPGEIIVIEGEEKSVFKAERDEKGNFMQRSTKGSTEPLRYIDEKGRVMLEGSLGQVTSFRGGQFVVNLLLNGVLLVVLFAAFWLLLGFLPWHALAQAVVCWLVLLLFVLPQLLTLAEGVAKERAAAVAARAAE